MDILNVWSLRVEVANFNFVANPPGGYLSHRDRGDSDAIVAMLLCKIPAKPIIALDFGYPEARCALRSEPTRKLSMSQVVKVCKFSEKVPLTSLLITTRFELPYERLSKDTCVPLYEMPEAKEALEDWAREGFVFKQPRWMHRPKVPMSQLLSEGIVKSIVLWPEAAGSAGRRRWRAPSYPSTQHPAQHRAPRS